MCPWQRSDKLERSQGSGDYPPGVTVHGHQLPNLGEGEKMVQPTRHTNFCKNRNTPRLQGANPPWGNAAKQSSRSGQIQLALKRQRGSVVKNPPAKQEAQVWSLVGRIPWRRKWQPTPEFLPEESHGQRSLASYSLWGSQKSQTRLSAWTTKR